MIGIYDKEETDIKDTFIQKAVRFVEGSESVKACGELSDLMECDIAIAHVSDKDWEKLIKEYSPSGYVRIRVTTDGTPSNKPPTRDKNEVYIFHLVMQTGDLTEEDWESILCGFSNGEIAGNLVKGENPKGLRRFFVHEVQERLPALTILCEGYLAVHAENIDCSEDISSALKLMRWSEFQKSDRYNALIREDSSEQISIVQCPQWWLEVFEQESFCEDVKKEWEDTTGTEEIPTALNDLLEAIHAGDTVVPPKIVADAYCVLQKKN